MDSFHDYGGLEDTEATYEEIKGQTAFHKFNYAESCCVVISVAVVL